MIVESHPKLPESVVLCVPEDENVIPFQVYGSSFSHTERFTVLVSVPFTLKFNVTEESHPKAPMKVALCVPEDENVIPFQVYGSSFSHTDRFTVLVSIPFTLKFNVTMESHPRVPERLTLCVPDDENMRPFQI